MGVRGKKKIELTPSPPLGERVAAGRVRGRDSILSHLQGQKASAFGVGLSGLGQTHPYNPPAEGNTHHFIRRCDPRDHVSVRLVTSAATATTVKQVAFSLFNDDDASHQGMSGTARPGTFKRISSLFLGIKDDFHAASSARRNDLIDIG